VANLKPLTLWVNWILWGGSLLLVTGLALSLHLEGEGRAPRRLLFAAYPVLAAWLLLILLQPPYALAVVGLAALSLLGGGLYALYRGWRYRPAGGPSGLGKRDGQVDERDTMFARMAYTPGGPAYTDYYQRHPERRELDDALRRLPELCGEGSVTYDPLNSRIAPAIFELLAGWHHQVDLPGAGEPVAAATPEERAALTRHLKGLARYYGAVDVGIAELTPEVVYSHVGRREAEYGVPVDLRHRYAIVFAVEMDYRFISAAPNLPVVVESSHQYLEAAKVGLALGANIRALGWDARVHMDGNYLGVLPPLAARAGLGEIGRLGLLVTERWGPRVRLGMVTTSLPLVPDRPRPFGLEAFCRRCKKCADNCPGRAISLDDHPGAAGWQISWEQCYKYWRIVGTDCAICINSCPYAKPQSPFHQLTRVAIRDSEPARRAALWLDDYLYGRRPFRRWEPDWF